MPFPFWANPGLDASAALKTAKPATTSNSFFIFPPHFLQPNKANCGWNSRSGGSRQNGVPLGGLGKRMVRPRNLEILLSRSPVLEQGDLTWLPAEERGCLSWRRCWQRSRHTEFARRNSAGWQKERAGLEPGPVEKNGWDR